MQSSISIRDLKLSFGSFDVLKNLNLEIGKGEFLVLLGSSGCGKSTLLNCIAGLLDVTDGQIFINGKNVTWEEPSDRGIGMVFQSYALYPQMTVKGNLAFGLKNAKVPKAEIEKRIARTAEVLQIESLLTRKPAALSGGQRQRVAIGRALVRHVDVFLFDEPLSNLDAKLRADLRVEIKRLHHQLKNTMIYVTHDQVEAMTLADRIAIMKGGVVMQLDSPSIIYNRPANKYVADFIGSPAMNFYQGTLDKDNNFRGDGLSLSVTGYPFEEGRVAQNQQVWLGIRPEHIRSADAAQQCAVQMGAIVELVEPMGSDTQIWSVVDKQNYRFRVDGQTEMTEGDSIRIGFDPENLSLFDRDSELRL
ncbi:ABC transporter ATP-binding protein [Leucothrix arctica]|uniref:ABC transporter ATP-binding protein n=2 Tax=Leucothrix arctica TaxID=1481894 RepID=A0A317CAF9_9GAMM|nr:ABC transporter ATP-binding protein [Leucothrix arctica]